MLACPDSERIFAIPEAMRNGLSVAQIHELTHIDPWFLHCISGLVETEDRLTTYRGGPCPKWLLLEAKRAGFSDRQIARILKLEEQIVCGQREHMGIHPDVRQIDSLAPEYQAPRKKLDLQLKQKHD